MKRKQFITWIAAAVTSLGLVIGLPLLSSTPVLAVTTTTVTTPAATANLKIYAAVSLTEVLTDIENAYNNDTTSSTLPKINFTNSLDSSGILLNLINQTTPTNNETNGIPDIFISAATTQMNSLQTAGKLATDLGTNYWPKTLATNRLVLIRPNTPASPAPNPIVSNVNALTNVPLTRGMRGVAIGDPATVPAGAYAKQVLENISSTCGAASYNTLLNSTTSNKLVFASNVRNVLSAVETQTLNTNVIDAGIVYKTDKQISTLTAQAQLIASSCHSPIVYPLAVLKRTTSLSAANAFANYVLTNSTARTSLNNRGFGLPS